MNILKRLLSCSFQLLLLLVFLFIIPTKVNASCPGGYHQVNDPGTCSDCWSIACVVCCNVGNNDCTDCISGTMEGSWCDSGGKDCDSCPSCRGAGTGNPVVECSGTCTGNLSHQTCFNVPYCTPAPSTSTPVPTAAPVPTCNPVSFANNDPRVCGPGSDCDDVDGNGVGDLCSPSTKACIPGSTRISSGGNCLVKCQCTEKSDPTYSCHEYGNCIYYSGAGCHQDWECVKSGYANRYEIRECAGTGTVDGQICEVGGGGGGGGGDSCSVNLTPASFSISVGLAETLTPDITVTSGTVQEVTYVADNSGIVTISTPDAGYPYTTQVVGVTGGLVNITASVHMSGVVVCSDSASVTVSTGPWWQVKDSDVNTNGNIASAIPTGLYFGLNGAGGFPGVAAYGGSISTSPGGISSLGWNTNSTNVSSKIFDYAFFVRQLPGELFETSDYLLPSVVGASTLLSGGYLYQGIYFYRYDGAGGDLTIDANIDLGSRRVAILTKDADVYIQGSINLTDGAGFLALLAGKSDTGTKGNIFVSPTLGGATPVLEGIYLSEGIIYTGTNGADLDSRLIIRGSLAGLSGISLQRDLADDNATPAELFEYAPDQIMILLSTPALSAKKMSWKEVAP